MKTGIFYSLFLLSLLSGSRGMLFAAAPQDAPALPDSLTRRTVLFAHRDTCDLHLDIYRLKAATGAQPLMIFVFGGGFVGGARDKEFYMPYFYELASRGITTVSIDYRLGMKGRKFAIFNTKPLDTAIRIAVEDLFAATSYLIGHAAELGIDTSRVMLSGSSAGAITVLHADYLMRNGAPPSDMLPSGFRFKGILSFAGAIFSHEGRPDYREPPAPTLFMHGNSDKLVPYKQYRLFNKGLFGSRSLAKIFRKRGYSYAFFTLDGQGHSVALSGMFHSGEIDWFIRRYVYEGQPWQTDALLNERDSVPGKAYLPPGLGLTRKQLSRLTKSR